MAKLKIQGKHTSRKGLILLGIIGIIGIILVIAGLFLIFEKSLLLGQTLLVLGALTYVMFILIERKLKIL